MKIFRFAAALLPMAYLLAGGNVMAQTTAESLDNAKPGDIRLIVTDGLKVALQKVRPDMQKNVSRPLLIEFGGAKGMQKHMDTGVPFELAVVSKDVADAEIAAGRMLPDLTVVARIHVGVFQTGGTPVDVSTPDALKKAILGAKNVRYSGDAAAAPTAVNVMDKLGLTGAANVHPSFTGQPRQAPVTLSGNEYELLINIVGEAVNPPLIFVGNVPDQLQIPVVVVGGIGAKGDTAAAKEALKYLMAPAFETVLKESHETR